MITTQYKPAFDRLLMPVARAVLRAGIRPVTITIGGLGLVAGGCVFLVLTRRILPFCVLVTLAALSDALDGAVARLGHQATRFGSYLDAMCDRYVEALVILAVAVVTGYWILSVALLAGSLLVSYAKARAAMEVPVSNLEWPDLMERAERDVCYVTGLALSRLVGWKPMGRDLFWWTLLVLGVLVHATVIQRMWRAKRLIQARS